MTPARQSPARPTDLLKFGAVANGPASSTTATSAALNAFGKWARAESAEGRAVHVTVPPGVYHFDQTVATDCFKGISTLVFDAHGATFLQTSPTGFPWPVGCDTVLYRNIVNPMIRAAKKGDTRVVVATPADLRHYAPGEIVMIAGEDIQFGGYPPNFYRFDFVRIRAVDPRSGVLTFDAPLSHDYRPDFASYPAQNKWGGSRVYKLDRNGFTWDIDHSFLGLTCRHAGTAHSNYILAMGRKVTFRDCDTPGFAESVCEEFLAERCVERVHSEPDKLVKRSVRRGGRLLAGIGMQSASVDQVSLEDCRIALLGIGGKSLHVSNCDIARMGFYGALGFNDETIFENCRIAQAQYCYPFMPTGSRYNRVDGTNVTYANGVFTVRKNDVSGLEQGGGLANWNMLPGQPLSFCRGRPGDATQNGSHVAGDLGAGVVLSVVDRPGAILIRTTLKSAGVPAWSSGQVFVKRRNAPVFRNCTGAEPVRLAAEAARAGKDFGAYFRYLLTAKTIAQGPVLEGRTGRLVRLYANVIKPMTGTPGAVLTLGEMSAYRASTMASPAHFQIDIDLTLAGKRDFTVAALRGGMGRDRVIYDGRPQPRLPADLWCDNGMPNLFCTGAPFTKNPAAAPVIELIFEFDVGMLARRTVIGRG
ncbi:MAG: hypothetical protein WC729_12805 [Sphingomonas sp.]|jgi:hypothetical protein|uniref:hypothetical protein n=1 Tax=Sphingomonas sp. TaxID=28214 RepID=UPI003564EA73